MQTIASMQNKNRDLRQAKYDLEKQVAAADDRHVKAKSELNAVRGVLLQIQGLASGLGAKGVVVTSPNAEPLGRKVPGLTGNVTGSKMKSIPDPKKIFAAVSPARTWRLPGHQKKYLGPAQKQMIINKSKTRNNLFQDPANRHHNAPMCVYTKRHPRPQHQPLRTRFAAGHQNKY